MRSVLLFVAVLLAITLVVNMSSVTAQETIAVRGRVVNGTEGATAASGLTVQLHAFSQTAGTFSTAETTTEDAGVFWFDDVLTLDEGGYALTADYGGTRYSTLLGPEELGEPLELRVYEPTQDISVVRVKHQALIISEVNEGAQEIEAAEFLTLTNTSDRTLVPDLSNVGQGRFSFLRFSLPPQAEGLDVQSDLIGGQIISTGSGFAMTAPVTPGDHSISFSFSFRYQGEAVAYRQSLLQGAEVYQVLVPDRLGRIQVGSLQSMPPIEVGGVSYRVWEGRGYSPGQGLEVRLTDLPQPSLLVRLGKAITGGTFWRVAIPVILGLTLAGLLLYGGVKAPRSGGAAAAFSGTVETPAADSNGTLGRRSNFVRTIAALDESFRRGEVEQAEYQIQREQMKTRVLETSERQSADLSQGGQ